MGPSKPPLIVPQGKIVDSIDGKFRDETPEEYVRQEIEKSLLREYLYPPEAVAVEFRVRLGRASKRADLAIFPENAPHLQENCHTIIECKAPNVSPKNKSNGVGQLQSYLAACLNCEFGMWTNGQERFCYRKVSQDGLIRFVDVADIPGNGKSLDESEHPKFDQLRPATSDSLLFSFKRCHNYIAGNQGLQKSDAFWELLKLIFCKIEDERSSRHVRFYATSRERQGLNGHLKVKARIDQLFHAVRRKYKTIFGTNEEVELEPSVLSYLVSQLQPWSLLDSDVDVKGKAYEEIVGSNLRGDRGEFFTPRNICAMAVAMLDPSPEDLVLDPACGTGGFLTIAMNHAIGKIRVQEESKWRRAEAPTERELQELYRKIGEYANQHVAGIDINPNLVKASKMNMVLNNDGSGGLYRGNSLARPVTWEDALRKRELIGDVDLIFTNPPFGSKIKIDDPAILEQYDLAHAWDYDPQADQYEIREPRKMKKSLPPEILFVERCVQFLKPGRGKLAIVLPDGILGAPGLAYVREWLFRNTRVLASVDLHPDTFQPRNSTQTSLLVLQRKGEREKELEAAAGTSSAYDVFMALANHIGHDKRGKATFVRDAEGNEVLARRTERVREVRGDALLYRTVEVKQKVRDDNTAEIAKAFREWAVGT